MRILDSDVAVEIVRQNPAVRAVRETIRDRVATTWITLAELYYGAAKSIAPDDNRVAVAHFARTLEVLGLDATSARIFGDIKRELERQGQRLEDADLMIGSIALAHRAVLVTGNRRHFDRFPGLEIEDWLRPASP